MKIKTRILLMGRAYPVKSLDLDFLLPNLHLGDLMRVFGKKTKILDISHTVFDNDYFMQVFQVKEIISYEESLENFQVLVS